MFVVAGNVLYRLSSQLQQLQDVSVSSPIVALTATDDGEWLVACFTTRTCTAYNTSSGGAGGLKPARPKKPRGEKFCQINYS